MKGVYMLVNTVMNVFDQMDPLVTTIQKMCQSDANNEKWSWARERQIKQLLVMI